MMVSHNYLPDCWTDNARMDALFADIRNKDVNPNDWKSKMKFWSGLVNDWCYAKKSFTFSIYDLREAFRRGGRAPKPLAAVVQQMKTNNEIMKKSDFFTMVGEPGWIGWTVNTFFRKPLYYSWSMFVSPPLLKEDEELVNFECLKNNATEMLVAHSYKVRKGQADSVTSIKMLHVTYRELFTTEDDLELALMWLNWQKKLTFLDQNGQKIIKFSADPTVTEKPKLTQQDFAVMQLKQSRQVLKSQIEALEKELDNLTETAKAFIRAGKRSSAKGVLIKKKAIENNITNKENALDNLEVMLERLIDSHTNKLIVDAFKVGTTAFKSTGLTLEEFDETMDDVQEAMETQQEIQQALVQPIQPYSEDLAELEAELDDLLKSDADVIDHPAPQKRTVSIPSQPKIPSYKLPSVPSDNVSGSGEEILEA